jgi:hypothetical protein
MKSPSIASRILMIFLLAIGILIGTALVGIATWGDMETVLFFSAFDCRQRIAKPPMPDPNILK